MDTLIRLTTDLPRWVPHGKPDTQDRLKSYWLTGDRAGMSFLIHKGPGWLQVFIQQSRNHVCLSIFKTNWSTGVSKCATPDHAGKPSELLADYFLLELHLLIWLMLFFLIQSDLQSSPSHWHRQNSNLRSPDNRTNTLQSCPTWKPLSNDCWII